MAEIHGNVGAIYYQKATITATTIAFVDSNPDTITDSGSGFVTAGFEALDYITVSGAGEAGNNDTFRIDTGGAAAGTLTLIGTDALTAESAGESVTIVEALPGTVLTGFHNWSLDYTGDVHETTDFGDTAARTYTAGLTGWTATAERYWHVSPNYHSWLSGSKVVRFFTRYTTAPNTTNAYYYSGTAIVTGLSTSAAVDNIVNETITFQGTGALAITTRSTAWAT